MDEKVSFVLALIGDDMGSTWVRDQLQSTFDEGITQRVSEQGNGGKFGDQVAPSSPKSATREQIKRDTYETTRSYSPQEQLDVLEFALEQVFSVLPAIQSSVPLTLQALAPSSEGIEFVSDSGEVSTSFSFPATSSGSTPPTDSIAISVQEFMQKVRKL